MIKERDINLIKSKNTESLKMVSKRLKTYYLKSYEQFLKIIPPTVFLKVKFEKKCDIDNKVKNTKNPKMVSK